MNSLKGTRFSIAKKVEILDLVKKVKLRVEICKKFGLAHNELEQNLVKRIHIMCESKISLSGPLVQEKVMEFTKAMNETNFVPSNGWPDRFKKREALDYKVFFFLSFFFSFFFLCPSLPFFLDASSHLFMRVCPSDRPLSFKRNPRKRRFQPARRMVLPARASYFFFYVFFSFFLAFFFLSSSHTVFGQLQLPFCLESLMSPTDSE